jgi:molybdopterin molybdotransferase
MLASLGRKFIRVTRRPKVAVISTGDELVDIEEELTPGKIRNINSYSLYAQVGKYGGLPHLLGTARDNPEDA